MKNKQKDRKKKARLAQSKKRVLAKRKSIREEEKHKKEIWLINRDSEKEINRMMGTTYRKPKENSENI
jgi:hypothetical protein|tara:strand:+ start:428 stop:631 length:204 start_codon:yes stop_codon:yes gene_type:complete